MNIVVNLYVFNFYVSNSRLETTSCQYKTSSNLLITNIISYLTLGYVIFAALVMSQSPP